MKWANGTNHLDLAPVFSGSLWWERGWEKWVQDRANHLNLTCDGDWHFSEQTCHFWDGLRGILKEGGSVCLRPQFLPQHTQALARAHTHNTHFFFSPRELFAIEQVEAQIALLNHLGKSICNYANVYDKAPSEAESSQLSGIKSASFLLPWRGQVCAAVARCPTAGQDWIGPHLCRFP